MIFKYPKLSGFVLAVIIAYVMFSNPNVSKFIANLGELGYLGAFIAGIFYTFGFSSPFSAGFFIDLNPSNVVLAGILGGLGAFSGDMFIFRFAKKYFREEFEMLGKNKIIKSIGKRMSNFVLYIFAAILIASPLPDEAGITMLAGISKIKFYLIASMSIIFNTLGIFILLNI
ncbi:MAG: hypothetical protein QW041_03160 [Candidatus Pacearchaeota archaeon]